MPLVVGLDPGWANLGWARFDLSTNQPVGLGVIRTKRPPKKKRLSKSLDEHHRGLQVATELGVVLEGASILCVEALSQGMAGGIGMSAVARAWGVIDAMAHARGLTVLHVPPRELKAMVAERGASKGQVADAVKAHWPSEQLYYRFEWTHHNKLYEHAYDALATILACWNRPEMVALRSAAVVPV